MREIELFGSSRCEHTRDLREWLEWRGVAFVEYDVDRDAAARQRFDRLSGPGRMVPLLVENGRITQVGWRGRGCLV